ncbi:Alpha galactosidase A [Actinacidiphila yanglinensis]|uniref:Alpha-galactosidase n=1 Tax=Actinacidiphila yanglinensis TaxID=310779 RepID=A0A1H6DRE3_9ACTN|nr:NEW3 domain-containing protein [Actinacidiphila yanglinensis]SEG87195.1 Alpha galactosidase A [Actinacidiphila yanglinensis]
MRAKLTRCLLPLLLTLGLGAGIPPAVASPSPGTAQDAAAVASATPPMGWSSWSALREGSSLTEDGIEAQARVLHDKLQQYGYQYINIDAGWSDHLDAYGRDTWDTTRFPDGIPALAAYLHGLGLKLGIYLTPGVPVEAYRQNLPILGTPYHIQDIADPTQPGNTNNDGYRIDFSKPGAQEYVQSYADLFASWGVDYIKMDFVGPGGGVVPGDNRTEMQAWHQAIDATGRPMHLELSNSLSIADAATWEATSNGWRTGGDIECYCGVNGSSAPLTSWQKVSGRFDQVATWQPYGGPDAFNDYDSIEVGNGDDDGLTPDERQTQLSLWSMAASPLLLGTDLTELDPADLRLLANRDVIAVDQDAVNATRVTKTATAQVFTKTEPGGDVVVGLFNTGSAAQTVSVAPATAGLPASSSYRLDNLWTHEVTRASGDALAASVPAHGAALFRVRPWPAGADAARPQTGLAVTAPDSLTTGQDGTAAADFTNWGTAAATQVHVALNVPKGWSATPLSTTSFASVAPGETVRATYRVTAPPSTSRLFATARLDATAGFRWKKGNGARSAGSAAGHTSVVLGATVQAPFRTFDSTPEPANFSQVGSTLSIRAAGADVYGSKNEYGAVYVPGAEHDGSTTTVRVTWQQYANSGAKTGIIVRNDVTRTADSPGYVTVGVSAKKGYFMQWDADGDGRLDSGTAANGSGVGKPVLPSWIRLVRSGTTYTGYYSTDGTTWTPLSTANVPSAAATQDVGLFGTAHNPGYPGQDDFADFSTSAG